MMVGRGLQNRSNRNQRRICNVTVMQRTAEEMLRQFRPEIILHFVFRKRESRTNCDPQREYTGKNVQKWQRRISEEHKYGRAAQYGHRDEPEHITVTWRLRAHDTQYNDTNLEWTRTH